MERSKFLLFPEPPEAESAEMSQPGSVERDQSQAIKDTCKRLASWWSRYKPSKLLGSFFGRYGVLVASHPWVAIGACLLVVR